MPDYPNLVLSLMLEHDGDLLVIKRRDDEKNYPGLWAPPGGKVEIGETIVDALRREVAEETSLPIGDELAILDTYEFGSSTCLTLLVRCEHRDIVLTEFDEYQWIGNLKELEKLERIKGIDYHYRMAWDRLANGPWQSLEEFQLKYD